MIISFAWTTPALLAGAKTITRRAWTERHARQFTAGMLVDAWDKSPRAGGKKIATIRLTRNPYLQPTELVAAEDWEREGFAWLEAHGRGDLAREIWRAWRVEPVTLYVVEFELVGQ